ncbi:MAG: GatB/YqeY domain-containing protein [Roseibacillus sp.]|nr:GatB/YqeY domain-containing protein [Roseibacillus sp.]
MAALANQLNEDLKDAMRAKDTLALSTLRAVKSALKNAAIGQGGADTVLDETQTVSIIRKQIKQRQDSVEQFSKGGRSELAEKESAEIAILERYLPAALTPEEVSAMVQAAIAETGASSRAEMGKVMKIVQEQSAGRVDGKTLSQAVMQALS